MEWRRRPKHTGRAQDLGSLQRARHTRDPGQVLCIHRRRAEVINEFEPADAMLRIAIDRQTVRTRAFRAGRTANGSPHTHGLSFDLKPRTVAEGRGSDVDSTYRTARLDHRSDIDERRMRGAPTECQFLSIAASAGGAQWPRFFADEELVREFPSTGVPTAVKHFHKARLDWVEANLPR